ncbi:MAG: coniferyl aldehyde dehydrogenase [Proteobacteria bacterium]|nr:coniferyl aldehyde dehydrogenase [Pseudomonadota bacterium]
MNKSVDIGVGEQASSARQTFDRLKTAYRRQPYIPFETRKETLLKIEDILLENDQAICDAICSDFGNRSHHETKILEIATSIGGLRHTRKKLKKWMKPQKRHVSILMRGAKNTVIPQAKGVVGIVTPWNYPLFLALSPLSSVVAAGNRVMLKLATNSQNLCVLLQRLFSERISEDLLTVLPGVGASEFSNLPFDHLVFTGSPNVGRTVMKTAGEYLTPVTLELGGKSPTILADDFDVETAVGRIMFSKLINCGQMCVAPDYMMVPEDRVDPFIEASKRIVSERYPDIATKDYTNVIDRKAYDRLIETLADARRKGAEVVNLLPGAETDEASRKISPMVVTRVTEEMTLMQQEIFGPILPIKTYKTLEEVIDYINDHERPLATYIFSNNRRFQDEIVNRTMSGGVTINDCAMHVGQHDLPFGGIGNSGLGQYHGYEGFLEFSKLRPIFKQAKKTMSVGPPYGKTFDRAYSLLTKMKFLS